MWVIDNNWLIHESPCLNPDWFSEIRLLEVKKLNISFKIGLSKIPTDRKERNWTIIFDILLVTFFVDRNNISFFPFRRKNASKKSLFKNYLKWFIYWVTTYLKHTNAYVIMTMCFIKIKILNNFVNSFDWKCDCR